MHTRSTHRIALALALMLILPMLAASADAGIRIRKPKFRGRIATVNSTPNPDDLARGVLGTMLVIGEGNKSNKYGQVLVTVTQATNISGLKFSRSTFAVLGSGMTVEITLDKDVPGTYPAQGVATRVQVLDSSYIR